MKENKKRVFKFVCDGCRHECELKMKSETAEIPEPNRCTKEGIPCNFEIVEDYYERSEDDNE